MAADEGKIRAAVALFLEGIGFVTPDVAGTPARVAEAMPDLLPGLFRPPPPFEVVAGPEVPGRPGQQERLTEDIAAFLARELRPRALRVRLSARHLCMEMPEPGLRGAILTTEAGRGEETFRPW
jgi:GTP cyclohydrolase I